MVAGAGTETRTGAVVAAAASRRRSDNGSGSSVRMLL